MKIGIDYSLATLTNRGMGRYIREIVNILIQSDNQNQYVLYTQKPTGLSLPSNFTERIIPQSNEIIAEQWHLPKMARNDKLDALWCPGNTFPMFLNRSIKLVVTIHDLIFFYPLQGNSNLRQKIGRIYRKFILKFFAKRIYKCLTVSNYSKKEIAKILGLQNVEVTYNCIDTFYNLAQALQNDFPPQRQDFYFTLSGDAPSKNLQFLINTFKNHLPDKKLHIAGLPANSSLRNQQTDNIIFLPQNLTDNQIIEQYNLCRSFIFVSLYEGFGIPVLEALACNAPIICSHSTSLPEVLGGCGLEIDPNNENQLIQAVNEIDMFYNDYTKRQNHINKFLHWNESAKIVKRNLTQ